MAFLCLTNVTDDSQYIDVVHSPIEPHQCILTHFNNRNFSKNKIGCSIKMVFFTPKYVEAF